MKEVHPEFIWYACKIIDHLSFEALGVMLIDKVSLDSKMKQLYKISGLKSYIAVVKLIPIDQ